MLATSQLSSCIMILLNKQAVVIVFVQIFSFETQEVEPVLI